MGALWERGVVKKVLVVAPTSVVAVWPKELDEYAAFPVTSRTLLGDKKQRIKALEDLEKYRFKRCRVAVINYESTWREGIFEALQDYDADMIICDESQRIKTHDAQQSEAMHKLGDKAAYKLILSGTPVQNQFVDIWSQYRFLDVTVFGERYYQFVGRYAVKGGFNNKQILGIRRDLQDELIRKEHSIAFRATKAEAIDLPEQTFETRMFEMDPKERDLYDQVRIQSCAELMDGGSITATTVLTKLLRLRQITGGFLVRDGGDPDKPEQVSTMKLDALKDIFEDYVVDAGRKVVVFAAFIPEVKAIIRLAEKVLPKRKKAVAIYGDIKKEARGEIVRQFQEDPDTMIFIGQIDTAGTGITLTAADTCIYYSKTYNYATYEQSLSRIHRIGQRNTCTYIDLVIERTVDEMITKALRKKEDLAKTIVDNWKEYFK
jgi:SNF2 family DNA or RNA helicase